MSRNTCSRRILIVDNEAISALWMRRGLEKLPNCEVLIAFSGEEARQCLKKQPVDLLITDYHLPDINGIDLAAQIRRLYPETVILIMTGDGNSSGLCKQATGLSVYSILNKPVWPTALRRVALEALEKAER